MSLDSPCATKAPATVVSLDLNQLDTVNTLRSSSGCAGTSIYDVAPLKLSAIPLYQVQIALGLKDQRMSARYAHLLPENKNIVKFVEGKGTATILLQSDKSGTSGNSVEGNAFPVIPAGLLSGNPEIG